MSTTILLTSILVVYLIGGYYWMAAFVKGAPYYPSSKKDIRNIVSALDIKPENKIAEIGSGDGRVAIALAKNGAIVTAIEVNPVLTLITRLKKIILRLNIEVVNDDMFNINFENYDAVVTYLYPKVMQKLEKKLYSELPKGGIIVSNTFQFKNRKPIKVIDNRVYVYEVK